MLETPTYEDDISTISAETEELIRGLQSFGQGGEFADPTTDTGFKHLLSKWNPKEIYEYKSDTVEKQKYVIHFASERAEGKAEGNAEGEVSGAVKSLIALLEFKFGTLSQQYIEKIMGATVELLIQWTINVLNAESLEMVFKD